VHASKLRLASLRAWRGAGSMDADVKKELDPFLSKGLLTITPFEDILQFDLPAQGQVLMYLRLRAPGATCPWALHVELCRESAL